MEHPEGHIEPLGDHYARFDDPSTGDCIVRTYHVDAAAKFFCEQVRKACVWALRQAANNELSRLEPKVSVIAGKQEWVVNVDHGGKVSLRFMVSDAVSTDPRDPMVRVHSMSCWEPAFDILVRVNDRLEEIYRGRWRDDVPPISGAPMVDVGQPPRKGGRPRDPLYERVSDDMERHGLSMHDGWLYYQKLWKEANPLLAQDRMPDFQAFRKAMEHRKNERRSKGHND